MSGNEKNMQISAMHQYCPADILIVDNDSLFEQAALKVLAKRGIRGIIAESIGEALRCLEKDCYQLVFLSAQLSSEKLSSGCCGLLKSIKAVNPETPVVLTAQSDIFKKDNPSELAAYTVNMIKAGFYDLILKPVEPRKIESILDRLVPHHNISTLASAAQDSNDFYCIVGRSAKLTQTINLAGCVAKTSAPVLISGESGTGKELISYLIHHQSRRTNGPYIKVNCAALSESLLESELFGHEKGAFTGAYTQRKGRFEMAHGGTLLLDEITETPPRFQAKLLRMLEQQDFQRVGGNDNIKVNVRIICTTNKIISEEIAQQRFRADLYYRLSTVRILLSPLRERPEDIPDLVWYFVNLYAAEANRNIRQLDSDMLNIFANYHWPGNVRQLRNVIRTSLILGAGETLSLADVSWLFDELQPRIQQNQINEICSCEPEVPNISVGGMPLEAVEQRAILETLRRTDGNQTKAAKVLGISDRTLRCKIKKYRQEGALQSV